MNPHVVIFGANGFLGRYLSRHYARQGREVVCVARSQDGWSGDGMFLEWDGKSQGPWSLALEGAAMVINLAGRSVNCRYTPENREEIVTSRVDSTRAVGTAVAACKNPPKLWLNASTAAWYRDADDAPQDEWLGEPGDGLATEVARKWEEAFFAVKVPGATRKIALRAGMVLAHEEGTVFDVLRNLVRHGLGGRMGSGNQRVSWIHMDDVIGAIDFLAADGFLDGVINLTAPEAPMNRDFMRTFREVLGAPLGLHAAKWMVALGARLRGTEPELVLKSRWVEPRRLREAGYVWRWPRLEKALTDLESRACLQGFFRQPERRSAGVRIWIPGRKVTAGSQ